MFPLKDRLGRYETQVRSYATLPKKKLFLVSFATVHNRENFYREEGGKKGRSGEIYIYNIAGIRCIYIIMYLIVKKRPNSYIHHRYNQRIGV